MSEFISKINDNGKDYIIRDAAAAPIESPNLRGVPTAPTAAQETKNDQIATTAFVHGLVNNNIDSKLGNPGGIATLDENGNIPSSQLPSYVDDVLDGTYDKENDQFLKLNGEIYSPESSKIYIDVNTRVTYRWTGTTYAEIASSLALGTTAATAFPGNRGLALEQEVAALSQGTVTYRGTIGTDGDIVKLPTTYKRGDMYRVVTEGTYSEQECEVGDFLFCTRDNILTVAALPSYDKNRFKRYIMYQKYNPQTGANGEIIFAAYSFRMSGTAHLNRAYYDIKDNVKQLYSPDSFYVYYHSTTDNGVTWTALNHHYGDLKDAIFIETETEAIRILNTVEEIYNNENAIIYSPNPWGLSGYATDWAVIQGNLEDTIGEGAIYIDPDETSSEIENIDSVTSAKYVSYNNANSGLEATNVQDAIDNIENSLLTGKKDITGKDLYYDLGNIKESFLASGKNLTNAPIPDTENWDYIIQQARSNNNVMQFANLVGSPYDLFFRSFEVNDEHFDMSFPTDWVSLSAGQSLKNSFVKYNSNEAGTIFGTPISGPGLYFFTIIESTSSTNRSNPTFGTMYVDSNYQSWISFQKGTNSVITDIKYYDNYNDLAYDQMVITLSANRYISVFTLKLDGCCNESELNKLS